VKRNARKLARAARHVALRARSRLTWQSDLRQLVERDPSPKLQIGCGPNRLPGWFNTDFYLFSGGVHFLDATKPLPFSDGSFMYVLTEHQIEHITIQEAQRLLLECFRVMRPGGRIRIATPSLEFITSLKRAELSPDEEGYVQFASRFFDPTLELRSPAIAVNSIFYEHGHRFIYDFETLAHLLQQAGFVDVRRCATGESESPELRGIDSHAIPCGSEVFNRLESLVVEALRP
jgi:predicted SAM-dependent methyltransferase